MTHPLLACEHDRRTADRFGSAASTEPEPGLLIKHSRYGLPCLLTAALPELAPGNPGPHRSHTQ